MPAFNLTNLPLWRHQFSREELKPVYDEIDKIIKNNFEDVEPAQHLLSGNLKYEYFLKDSVEYIDSLVGPQIDLWEQDCGYLSSCAYNDKPHMIQSLGAWANFQRKHEVNPLHHHGGIVSWAMWLKLPYTRKGEIEACPEQSPDQVVGGNFAFAYTNILGRVETATFDLDERYEGTLLIFPAQLKHMVYPFRSSDELRISVAGNWAFAT